MKLVRMSDTSEDHMKIFKGVQNVIDHIVAAARVCAVLHVDACGLLCIPDTRYLRANCN